MNETAIEAVYTRLPRLECKRLCGQTCCGLVPATIAERHRIKKFRKERHLPYLAMTDSADTKAHLEEVAKMLEDETIRCPYLKDGLCSIYEVRPSICRIWGMVEKMKCPFGCEPSFWLTDQQAGQIIRELERLDA